MRRFAPTVAVLLAACAATYETPTTKPAPQIRESLAGSRADLLKLAKRVLVAHGYQVASSDDAAGTISTAAQDFRLTPDMADCGTTMGIDYLKDNRTSARVGYGLVIDDGSVLVRAVLQAEYKPGDALQNITLTCVSRGVLERQLLALIKADAS